MSLYTATIRRGPVETRYDQRATTQAEAVTMIAARAGVDVAAVHNPCRVLGHGDWEAA